jgi:hypothetical protein
VVVGSGRIVLDTPRPAVDGQRVAALIGAGATGVGA